MRSALPVFSLSISAPQTVTILSSSLAEAAAMQGAGSTCRSFEGSAPVASAAAASPVHRANRMTALRITMVKTSRMDWRQHVLYQRKRWWQALWRSHRVGFAAFIHVVPANAGTHTPRRLL